MSPEFNSISLKFLTSPFGFSYPQEASWLCITGGHEKFIVKDEKIEINERKKAVKGREKVYGVKGQKAESCFL